MKNIYDNKDFFDEYAKMSRSSMGLDGSGEWHQLKEMFDVFQGKKVLDMGCGYGWHSYYAAINGADEVIAFDESSLMLEKAKEINSHEKIIYLNESLSSYDYPEEYFHTAVSNLVLHYVEDLKTVYENVFFSLKKGGSFVFNIEHPTFTGSVNQEWIIDEDGNNIYWPVDNYYYPGERNTIFLGKEVKKYHHTLTGIIMPLLETGFTLTRLIEAYPSEKDLSIPGMKDEMRRPMMLMIKAVK